MSSDDSLTENKVQCLVNFMFKAVSNDDVERISLNFTHTHSSNFCKFDIIANTVSTISRLRNS